MSFFKTCGILTFLLAVNVCIKFLSPRLPSDCGLKKDSTRENASHPDDPILDLEYFPWIARLGIREGKDKYFYCSGSLIHELFVLTAAHCGKQTNIVRLGQNNLKSNKCAPFYQDIEIAAYGFANHCRLSSVNDLAILALKRPARLNDLIQPICIPQEDIPQSKLAKMRTISAGWGVVYSGWGAVDTSVARANNHLQYVNVSVVDPMKCNGHFIRNVSENELCVEYSQAMDSCIVDSGGALVTSMKNESEEEARAYVVGVASHGLLTCQSEEANPIVFTDISSFRGWILENIASYFKKGRFIR